MEPNTIQKVNLAAAFASFDERWSPRIAAELNGQHVKLAKLEGPFVWHRHEDEDELFLVVQGRLVIELRDGAVTLEPGEFVVVPRGVEHRPFAEGEVHLLLFEPAGTLNTGDVVNERTVPALTRL
jgi:mannose-6-phosphate isomerase-like protein (cupin superfamily)